ncbi:hypothetical protein [Cupriavidus sp. IDO]|uniref:hypothetical protein n=1 Tax=Cupriavidus sp. IDO TaxID=1539142 RepID=UPI001269CCC8|nr:hypothetical protein [Cupriavidus sp. IDO]
MLPDYVQDQKILSGKWGPCPFCSGGSTFRVVWERRGKGGSGWYCAKCETGGDLVGVIHEVTGKPLAEIYSELREARYKQGMAPSTFIPKVVARPEKTPEEYRAILRNIWERGLAITEDSPVWKYLCHRVPGLHLDWLGPDVRLLQRLVAAGDKTARTLQRILVACDGQARHRDRISPGRCGFLRYLETVAPRETACRACGASGIEGASA